MNKSRITLKVHRPFLISNEIVRIDSEAFDIVRQIQTETGLSARKIISEFIKQGYNFLEIKEV